MKKSKEILYLYNINIKLFFEFWMVPKTTVTTVTVTLEKKFQKKSKKNLQMLAYLRKKS